MLEMIGNRREECKNVSVKILVFITSIGYNNSLLSAKENHKYFFIRKSFVESVGRLVY